MADHVKGTESLLGFFRRKPAKPTEEPFITLELMQDGTRVYVSIVSLCDFLSLAEKVWGDGYKPALRGVRGTLLEQVAREFND